MNQRDRGQQGRRGGRDDEGYARSQRDTYSPEPQWLRQDRESRQWTGGRDEEVEYGIGRSQYGGNQYGYGGAGREDA